MPFLTIAGGKSVTDYPGEELAILAKACFTIGVNNSGFIWPSDVIVALDPDWILKYRQALLELKRPIVTRKWSALKDCGLDLIELPNKIKDRLSGQVAAWLCDGLAVSASSKAYVIGMDATAGHYYDDISDCSKIVARDAYDAMGLKATINLGMVTSKISAWPKVSKLPKWNKCIVSQRSKEVYKAWIRGEASKICA